MAVVNVVTRRGRDVNATEASGEAGSWNSYKGRGTFGERFGNGLEALFSGSFYNSAGHPKLFYPEFDSPATNNGIAQNADGDQSSNSFADFIYKDFRRASGRRLADKAYSDGVMGDGVRRSQYQDHG